MSKKIRFVLSTTAIAGGVHVIFRYADWLLEAGNDVGIIVLGVRNDKNWVKVDTPIYNAKDLSATELSDIDILIATSWSNVDYVESILAKRKVLFIQADEQLFTTDYNIIRNIHRAYKSELESVVNSKWLQNTWLSKYSKTAGYIPNNLDSSLFFQSTPYYPKVDKPRILLEGNLLNPYKGMADSYEAIKDLDCEIWVVSSYGTPPKDWKIAKFFQAVPFKDLQKIYCSCDISIKMSKLESFFLPPMEAMACGCAVVVGKVLGYDEYIIDGYNALVVNQGNILGATKAVQSLIDNKALRGVLIENGFKTVQEWPVENSRKAVLQYFT